MILEKEELLRSELFNSRCEDDNFWRTIGQKAETIFNELEFFSEFNCLSVDIAHDILEGIAQAEIKLFLKEVVEKKVIRIEDLNERIMRFNYGLIESANKPSHIVLTQKSNLVVQRAVQTRCLKTFLPLIISSFVAAANHEDRFPACCYLCDACRIKRIDNRSSHFASRMF